MTYGMSYTKFPPLDRQADRTILNTFKAQGLFQQGYSYKIAQEPKNKKRKEKNRVMKTTSERRAVRDRTMKMHGEIGAESSHDGRNRSSGGAPE